MTKKVEAKKTVTKFVLIIALGFTYTSGLFLLMHKLMSGSEFILYILSLSIGFVILLFPSKIQEVSIGGSVVKLREVKNENDAAIATLSRMRQSTISIMLRNIQTKGSGNYTHILEDRVNDFKLVFTELDKDEIDITFRDNINEICTLLMKNQIQKLCSESRALYDDFRLLNSNPLNHDEFIYLVEKNKSNLKASLLTTFNDNEIDKMILDVKREYAFLFDVFKRTVNPV